MKTTYRIITPDGTETVNTIDLPRDPGYDALKAMLDPIFGDYFERVAVLYNGAPADMFVGDTGLLKGLPRNEKATTIYRAANQAGRSAIPKVADPEILSFIAGTAVLFERRIWF